MRHASFIKFSLSLMLAAKPSLSVDEVSLGKTWFGMDNAYRETCVRWVAGERLDSVWVELWCPKEEGG